MATNEDIKNYIKKNFTPKEYQKSILYIEPENFDINKVTIEFKQNNGWSKIIYMYEYREGIKNKLVLKSNYSELNCTSINGKFKNFNINLNSQTNLNLKNILHKLDVLSHQYIKEKTGINYKIYYSFASYISNGDVLLDLNSNKSIKCKCILKDNVNETKVIVHNSKTKIKKELEKGKNIDNYEIFTDLNSDNFSKLMINYSKKDNYGGYNIKYLLSPQVNIGPIQHPTKNNAQQENIWSASFETYQAEIKHVKSNTESLIDQNELIMNSTIINEIII